MSILGVVSDQKTRQWKGDGPLGPGQEKQFGPRTFLAEGVQGEASVDTSADKDGSKEHPFLAVLLLFLLQTYLDLFGCAVMMSKT